MEIMHSTFMEELTPFNGKLNSFVTGFKKKNSQYATVMIP